MKILHLCLACFYIDGYNYQENLLPRIHKEDGHEVRILASTETFVDNQHLGYVEPREYVTEYGVPIKRLPYVKIGTHFSTIKIRKYPNVYKEIAQFSPDVIMSHDLGYWSVLDVVRYKKKHPEVKLYADTHADGNNSGTNWLSLHVLHRHFYRHLIHRALPYVEKYLCISEECRSFALSVHNVPNEVTEFFPLGGNIPGEAQYVQIRENRRRELRVSDGDILFVHSGKLDALKRTSELLRAFATVKDRRFHLAVIGAIPEEENEFLLPLLKADDRVTYLGWKSAEELFEYLCACDIYCQPGSQSVTMQNAVCCGCGLLLYPYPAHTESYDYGNILWVKDQHDMEEVFRNISNGSVDPESLKQNSRRCARELLDYRSLAARLYS